MCHLVLVVFHFDRYIGLYLKYEKPSLQAHFYKTNLSKITQPIKCFYVMYSLIYLIGIV